jgi:hypothetical protein
MKKSKTKTKTKKNVKVRDMKPKKDAKEGVSPSRPLRYWH